MKSTLPQNLIALAEKCPYPLYVVGGRVRDFLAGISASAYDNDICAPASAEDFVERAKAAGFNINAVYKNTGTVKLTCGGEDYEFTCFRSDEYVRGEHKPIKTYFTDDIMLDALRRDFKCNAVYYDICGGQFVDPLGGIADIGTKRVTTVADPDKVFGEDGLRLMRLARISAQTGFTPVKACLDGARHNARLIGDVSAERVFSELCLILSADKKYGVEGAQYAGLEILKETGVLARILPELACGENMSQRGDIHKYDVLEHSLRTVLYADESVRLAALLHDIGKPRCMLDNGNYYRHEVVGEGIAKQVCARLKAPRKLTERVAALVRLHMYDLLCDAKENKVRKFIVKNLPLFEELMLLKQADFSACRDDLSPAPAVVKMRGILAKMRAEGVPLTVKELAVRGDELIAAGFPKERISAILEGLLLDCCINQVENGRDKLLKHALTVANKN